MYVCMYVCMLMYVCMYVCMDNSTITFILKTFDAIGKNPLTGPIPSKYTAGRTSDSCLIKTLTLTLFWIFPSN